MNRLTKKQASVADVAGTCIVACKDLVRLAATPGIQYKDQCKQLLKFAKSLLIPLEDLSDNTYADANAEAKAACGISKVAGALDTGLKVVQRCLDLGRLEALMTSNDLAASFANVAQELQHALEPLDLAALGCDEITVKQASITLEQLRKVQAPFPEEQQRMLIQLRKLTEAMRVQQATNSAAGDPDSPASQLRELVHSVLDGGEMRQLVVDRAMLRGMHSAAVAARNHVEAFFCDCLLAAVRELLPDDMEPTGADLLATVIVNAVETAESLDVAPEDELLAALAQIVQSLKRSLVKPSLSRPVDSDAPEATQAPPRRSPKEMERLESDRKSQMLSCLDELLAVTAAMPEQQLPLGQSDIVAELATAGTVEPLVACLHVKNLPAARLQSAELLEQMITVQPSLADEVTNHDGVSVCIQALLHPDTSESESKPKSIALKSGTAACGADSFTPRLRAALLLKAMCVASDRAKAALAAPPSPRKKRQEQQAPVSATRRAGRASRLTEMIRSSQQSLASTTSEAPEAELSTRGALSTVIQALAKVAINEAAAPAEAEAAGALFKPRPRAAAVRVRDLSDEELDQLHSGSPSAAITLRIMATAAEVLEALAAEQRHAAVLVAQGGLHAALKALEWDLAPEINTACATVVYLLASRDAACLQVAVEAGVCNCLAEMSASEHPEEQAAAARALSLILNGTGSSVKAAPGLGAKAAATAGQGTASRPPFPDAASGSGEPSPDLIGAHRFRRGGGIPQSSLFPMMQIVAMQDVATSAVELRAIVHGLLTAAESTDLRQAMHEISEEMETETEPLRPFSVLAGLAVDLTSECSEPAFGIVTKLCLGEDSLPSFGPRFRPYMEPTNPHVEGAMRRLASLLVAQPHSQKAAAAALCASLADGIDLAVAAAVAHASPAVRSAAVVLVGAFCRCCSPSLLPRVIRRDPTAAEGQPELMARLVALVTQPPGCEEHEAAAAALRAVAQGVPTMRQPVLEKLVSAACSCETEDKAAATVTALHGCVTPPGALPTAAIAPEWKELLGVQLGAIQRFLTLSASCGAALQAELVFLVMRLCTGHASCIDAVRHLHCRVVVPDATGALSQHDTSGVQLLLQLLGHSSPVVARACACALLGEVALAADSHFEEVAVPGTGTQLSTAELERLYGGDGEGCAAEDVAPRTRERRREVPVRGALFQQGAVEPMLEALFDVTAALVRHRGGATGGSSAGGSGAVTGPQRGKRGPGVKAELQEAQAPRVKPVPAALPPGGDRLETSQHAAVKAVVNMTFGEPAECQREACTSLVKALKSGTPTKRLACAQVLQHTLAHQNGRVLLHGMQIIPGLVALCSTGLLEARKAAAEGLTNLAASSTLAPSRSLKPETQRGMVVQTTQQPQSTDSNPKVEVQRAGAIAPLVAMLKQSDEACIQASASTLYVLAEDEENRAAMQAGSVREALQNVLALAKVKPPKISQQTRVDCEQAMSRMLA
eukprot:jgi/Ulvmu1/1601/UM111_0029.1